MKHRTWAIARGQILPGLALAGLLAGCVDGNQPTTTDTPRDANGPAATTTTNPTPEQVINANPSSPSVPTTDAGSSPETGTPAPADPTPKSAVPDIAPAAEIPKVIETPAEPTPSDKSAEPK